jgi:citrate synthase
MAEARYLTAREASARLGVSAATLYAYVSRGLIRSEAVASDSRVRRYHAEDVRKLVERKEQRRNPAGVARAALHWGAPVLESALTLITEDGLYYRGHDVLHLSTTCRFEEVAALLWTGRFETAPDLFATATADPAALRGLAHLDAEMEPLQRCVIALTLAEARDPAAYTLQPEAGTAAGARILRLIAAGLSGAAGGGPIAPGLADQWAGGRQGAADLLNAALILCADHELNASSFAARVVASADVPLYSVVIAGLSALQGAAHRGLAVRVATLLREIGEPEQAARGLAEWLRRGERIPGFGHKLYPHGDPRARHLLALIADAYPDAEPVRLTAAISQAAEDLIRRQPNIDFALAVLAQVLDLPPDASLSLFALGRTAGWIAHALEQYAQGTLIRPRATYTGAPIVSGGPE